ncbi:LacI family transcriptional regulator [Halodurantibacterium flavum]|uniref:LacI family transcriptional regulator n=1 Tax=Halodurantibacterium flavum TaxID=1382802 RepID=A0ABW4S092_9RHOB
MTMTDDSPPTGPDHRLDAGEGRPTLKTIAQRTGLAVATVSRALKDAPDIGEETKRRVREVARDLGYRPNRAGVRLRTGKTNVIALVMSTEHDVMNHTARLIYSIAGALRETPYHLIVAPFFASEDPMQPIRYLVESGSADGIIINQTRPEDPRVAYMSARGVPFATHGRTAMGIPHPFADFDNAAYGAMAVRRLAAAGRRRVLLIAPPRGQTYAEHMIEGARAAAPEAGVDLVLADGISSDDSSGRVEAALRAIPDDAWCDGIISGSTNAAMCAVAAAESRGQRLGAGFDVVAKEAVPFLHRFRREMIVVREDVTEAGDFLARAVMAVIAGADPAGWQHVALPSFQAAPAPGED